MLLLATTPTAFYYPQHIKLDDEQITIGKNHKCTLWADFSGVSSLQCRIVLSKQKRPYVIHYGNKRDTLLNGTPLELNKPQPLQRGDVIDFGEFQLSLMGYPALSAPLLPHVKQELATSVSAERLHILSQSNVAAKRVIAAREDVPHSLIEELCRNEFDEGIIEALVANSLTPLPWLKTLLPFFPAAFLENPILPLLLLESPTLTQLSPECLAAIFAQDDVPDAIVAMHAQNPTDGLCYQTIKNKKLSFELLLALAMSEVGLADYGLQDKVNTHPNMNEELREKLRGARWERGYLMSNPPMPPLVGKVLYRREGFFPLSYENWQACRLTR
jgi:hypothetical protein